MMKSTLRIALSFTLGFCLVAAETGCRSRLVTDEDKTEAIVAKANAQAAEMEAVAAANAAANAAEDSDSAQRTAPSRTAPSRTLP